MVYEYIKRTYQLNYTNTSLVSHFLTAMYLYTVLCNVVFPLQHCTYLSAEHSQSVDKMLLVECVITDYQY